MGVADDLWKFGKATGVGGPWKDTPVKAGVPSDPYLMTGFEQKTATLLADRDTTIHFQIDVTGSGDWAELPTKFMAQGFRVKAGEPQTIDLQNFRAYWIRAVADRDCTATVQFLYR